MENAVKSNKGGLVKGSIVALVSTLILILIFAVVLKFVELNDSFIMPINQVIKVVSIFLGVKVMLKNCKEKGLLRGVLLGLIYTLISYTAFSLLSKSFIFDLSVIIDIIFGSIIGGICGVIMVNYKK